MTKSTSYVISTFQFLCFVRTCEISMSEGFRAFKRQRLNFVLITKFPILFFRKCSGHHREKWRHFGSVTFYQWQRSRAWVGGYKRFTCRISSEQAAHKYSDLLIIVRDRAECGVQDRKVSCQIIHLIQKVQEPKERCEQSPVKAKAEQVSPLGN